MNSTIQCLLLLYILCSFLCFLEVHSLKVVDNVAISSYEAPTATVYTCKSLGYDFFDSSSLACKSCPTNQTSDTSLIDGVGNSGGCMCKVGFFRTDISMNCFNDLSGDCTNFNCTSCMQHHRVPYRDQTGCAGCGPTTLGISHTIGDCKCPNNFALVETDVAGNYLTNKTCSACPTGSLIITTDTNIAGKFYTANRYLCQYCPDPLMTMLYTSNIYSCRCPTGYSITGNSGIGTQSCIFSAYTAKYTATANTAASMTYFDATITLNSLVIQHYYLAAISSCTYTRNTYASQQACQTLANLCVLQLYGEQSIICTNYLAILSQYSNLNNQFNITNWIQNMPWLYYSTRFRAHKLCRQAIHQSSVSLVNYRLYFVLAIYTLNGTFQGFQPVDDAFASYCIRYAPQSGYGGGHSRSTMWQLYGSNDYYAYTCDLRSILSKDMETNLANQYFYELYLYDPDATVTNSKGKTSALPSQYTPVAVRIMNLRRNNDQETYMIRDPINYPCDNHDQLVHRFYLYDIVSGISTLNKEPQVIRYASTIKLEVYRDSKTVSNIFPPVLTIEYKESVVATWDVIDPRNTMERTRISTTGPSSTTTSSNGGINPANEFTNKVVSIEFEASYTMNLIDSQKAFQGFAIAYFIISMIVFAVRYYNWNLRNSRVVTAAALTTDLGGINYSNLFMIVIMALNTYVLMVFPLLVLLSWYFFVFYKLQSVPSVLLPPSITSTFLYNIRSPYYLFIMNLYCMTFFQCAYVLLVLVYQQSQNDLYFIDWEPNKTEVNMGVQQLSKGMVAANSSPYATPQKGRRGGSTPAGEGNITDGPGDTEQGGGGGGDEDRLLSNTYHPPLQTIDNHSVSIWRTILIANEFIKLQTLRRSNIVFTLFWLGFTLLGMNLQYNATQQPDLHNLTPNEVNIMLRFANATFFWLIFSVAQYLWKYVIYERFITEPPEQLFVDYCTISKISLLVLDEKYHGYYLHCRSPYPYADSNMFDLIAMLTREEMGLTIDRSLDGAPFDVQSFELFLSAEWVSEYSKLVTQLLQSQSLDGILESRRFQRAGAGGGPGSGGGGVITNEWNAQGGHRRGGGGGGKGGGNIWSIHHRNRYHRLKSSMAGGGTGGGGNDPKNHHFQMNRFQYQKGLKLGYILYANVQPEQIFGIWKEIILFFKEFVENNFQKSYLRRIIHEPNYMERMLYTPPDLSVPNQPSVLYTDRYNQFTSVLFLGHEYNLLLYNILIYSMVEFWTDNTMVAILICYLCDWGICKLRHSLGQANISKKTIIDGRFLVNIDK